MGALIAKPTKLLPFSVAALLTYRIYKCPCEALMSCTYASSLLLAGSLLVMTLAGYPLF